MKSAITQKGRKENEFKQKQAVNEAKLNPNSVNMLARIKAKQEQEKRVAYSNTQGASESGVR